MMNTYRALLAILLLVPAAVLAQVNSGSNGSDGAFHPTSNIVIDMANRPDGIYQYTSVNIPAGVTVSFIPNAANKPVVWLVQGNCVIGGTVSVSSQPPEVGYIWQPGGAGGFRGGNAGGAASAGQGAGGGSVGSGDGKTAGGNGSHANSGGVAVSGTSAIQANSGTTYGNSFLLPLIGGSGGGGNGYYSGSFGGGGGGAILIASSGSVTVEGSIRANGSQGGYYYFPDRGEGGAGSGGAIRIVAMTLSGNGSFSARGGAFREWYYGGGLSYGGNGRVRLDTFSSTFSGDIGGILTQGFQPIVLPASGQGIQLAIQSVGGVAVASSPSGVLANPDVIVPAQQTNPVSVVVKCTNVPLNSEITVVVHPANGSDVQAVGLNNSGTTASSTATVSLNMPRGGGIIYAKAVTGIAGTASTGSVDARNIAKAGTPLPTTGTDMLPGTETRSLAETGWTADGERFKAMEITAQFGGKQSITYIAESGKRYPLN